MKKSLITLSALSMISAAAHAQSSVTLYGIVDADMLYTNNVNTASGGKSQWQLVSGNANADRWGLLGSEDLGGGYKALFRLENGFNINNGALGQGGREFGRQAYVGLGSTRFGTVTMGRQYNPMQDFMGPLTAEAAQTQLAAHPYDNDSLNNTYRLDNTVKYATPIISGFQAEALYGFSNSTNFASNRAYGFGASYQTGSISLGAGYTRVQAPGAVGGTAIATPSSAPSNPLLGALRVDQWGVGGTYALGSAIVGLMYTGSLFTHSTMAFTAPSGTVHFQNVEGSFRYYITPALVATLAQTYTSVSQTGNSGHILQTSAGADYFLSKRTDVYLNAVYQHGTDGLKGNINGTSGAASSGSQVAVDIGIRQRF
ncbi:porin [Paraburkholderia pallida]|uniref:Porin n=1 Tax=Paraburkholderia pallida TaxID=2547399 RepID=A0A4P7D493_9BURK|nr:porin [Paraburkholderia pallida]QBR01545.1 porin [Paraburkholderia pallida]